MNVPGRVTFASGAERSVLRCLGHVRIENAAGEAIPVRTRKARALLAVLALSGRPMSRDALADLLWSDRGPVQARGSLRQAIFELQHVSDDADFLSVGRDDLAIRSDRLGTDVDHIRDAARGDDAVPLASLLGQCDGGFLIDLDGLDSELDSWLRVQRAKEPASTIAAAVDAAERLIEGHEPRLAMSIIEEVLRLDPAHEQAARAALRIDHALGDSSALRRHYRTIREQLRDNYDVEPSTETTALYARLVDGNDARARFKAEAAEISGAAEGEPSGVRSTRRWMGVAGALGALAVAVAGWFLLLREPVPRPQTGPVLLAVLPFEQQGQSDSFLAEGLWDDTRSAVSRTGAVRVLGRATTAAAVERKLSPDEYGRRFGVAYLLEGAVRQIGQQVRVSISLTRTADGVAVWEDIFAARVGDPFSVQSAIAGGIEGMLRGRLAPGGGHRADQIATSPEVYALYSRARALLRERGVGQAQRAQALLRQAVAIDPNFAPAWSSLAAAIYFGDRGLAGSAEQNREARQAAAHALSLAPRLAEAQATLGLLEGDNAAESEIAIKRAVALDPSYVEAWNWLGNSLASQARYSEAEAAYGRAVALDPLWFVAARNLVSVAHGANDPAAIRRTIATLTTAGAGDDLIVPLKAEDRMLDGDYSQAVQLLSAVGAPPPAKPDPSSGDLWVELLTRLGNAHAAARRGGIGDWYGPVVRGQRAPPSVVDGKRLSPADFWQPIYFSAFASRALVNVGRGDDLVRLYRAAFRTPDDFVARLGHGDQLVYIAPVLAAALRSSGSAGEADYVLSVAATTAEACARNAPHSAVSAARLAYVRAAQGESETALSQLALALDRGWLPDGRFQALDFALEPAFAGLRSDPRLRVLRKRVLDHIANERAELGRLPF